MDRLEALAELGKHGDFWAVDEHDPQVVNACLEGLGATANIALVNVYGEWTLEAGAAYARLIAAAPRMYAVMSDAAAFMRSGDVDTRGGKSELSRLAAKFHALIAEVERR